MKISVITVSYNSAATIADTLRSVSSQSHSNIEHIIIDGGSTDGTLDIISQQAAHRSRIVSEPDEGIYDAMNKGLALASGDVVGFLNSDDTFACHDSLALIARALADKSIDACYADLVFFDPDQANRIVRYWQPGPYVSGACRRGWMAPHPTFYVRRNILLQAEGFSLKYRLQSDFELMLRLFDLMQINSIYIPETLIRMRIGGATTGSLRNIIRGNIEAARACRANGFKGGVSFLARKVFGRLPQLIRRPRI